MFHIIITCCVVRYTCSEPDILEAFSQPSESPFLQASVPHRAPRLVGWTQVKLPGERRPVLIGEVEVRLKGKKGGMRNIRR